MWTLAFAIYAGLKWLMLSRSNRRVHSSRLRAFGFVVAWPGMDADAFLDPNRIVEPPILSAWLWAVSETAIGAVLLWFLARHLPSGWNLARGWVGMLGLIFLLHFGTLQLTALAWQRIGVKAEPIMSNPLRSTSLSEFWGRRWNLGFRQLGHELVFRPLYRSAGPRIAGFAVFIVSGLIHDLVISFPARGGYGLPTLYFVIQGGGVIIERSQFGQSLKLMNGARGWCFTMLFLTVPLFWLFHPWFVMGVILPFMRAIRAL
jgi:alginate O-acetyltransferase complex protein AlgI